MSDRDDGEALTVSLTAQLRDVCERISERHYDGAAELHELLQQLSNPNLPFVEGGLTYRVDQWDDAGNSLLRLIAACGNGSVARGAYNTAVKIYPEQRWTLRQGTQIIEEHLPVKAGGQ